MRHRLPSPKVLMMMDCGGGGSTVASRHLYQSWGNGNHYAARPKRSMNGLSQFHFPIDIHRGCFSKNKKVLGL